MTRIIHLGRKLRLSPPLLAVIVMCAASGAALAQRATFPSPEAAADALVAAVKSGKPDAIVGVLGESGRDIASSGDAVIDSKARERFLAAYDETHTLQNADGRTTLVLGKDEFPFPIPIVADGSKWRFDTEAGLEEILNRRIGEDELAAIETMRAYVGAQYEYAETDRDGKGPQYARRLVSTDGKTDGLYWPAAEGEAESPLGPLVASAQSKGYRKKDSGPTPYHGYLFRILTRQGEHAKGGAKDFIVGGRMIGGFGLVASPADYGNSGIMTFIVDQTGNVFQKDLGAKTGEIAAGMTTFDPDSSWTAVPNE